MNFCFYAYIFTSGATLQTQAWVIKRLLSTFNRVARRPHRPRSMILRRLMGVAGIPVPPSPVRPSRGSNDDSSNESEESSSTLESDDGSESAGEVPDDHGDNDGSGADGEIKAEGGGDEVKEEPNPLPNPDLKVPSKEAGEVSRSTPGSTGSGGDKASASGSASSGSPRVSGLHTYSFFYNN